MASDVRKCGRRRPSVDLDERARQVCAMSESAFSAWCTQRLERVSGSPLLEYAERRKIAADRRLRAWAEPAQAEERPNLHQACQSPLEVRLLAAFLVSGYFEACRAESDLVVAHGPLGLLLCQLPLTARSKRYRLDFAIVDAPADVFLAVEVDGYEWHSSRAALQYDRERDRRLKAAGWEVLRFAGREVHQDAFRCVREVLRFLGADIPDSRTG